MAEFNFDAALKDGVPIETINQEAARRIGFKYDQAISDGIPQEDILKELQRRYSSQQTEGMSKARLGLEAIEPSVPYKEKEAPSFGKKLVGAAEAAGTLLTSPLTGIGNIAGAVGELAGQGQAEKIAENINKYISIQPQTEVGKEYTENVAKAIDPLNAIFPNLSMMRAATLPISGKLTPPIREAVKPETTLADRFNAAKEGTPASLEAPIEPGMQSILTAGTPGRKAGKQRGKAKTGESSELLTADRAAQFEKLKEQEIEIAFRQKELEQSKNVLSKEEAFAEMEKLREEQAALDSLRRDLLTQEEPPIPGQASPLVEKIQGGGIQNRGPLGQTALGKGQRGSISFFQKETPSFEKYKTTLEKQLGKPLTSAEDITIAKKMYEGDFGKKVVVDSPMGKIPWAEDIKLTGDIIPGEQLVKDLIQYGMKDLESLPGNTKQYLASSGRLQRDLVDHPVVSNIYNVVTKMKEDGELAARRALDDRDSGIIPYVQNHILAQPFKNIFGKKFSLDEGTAQVKDVLNWRMENEGIVNAVVPEKWNLAQKELNSLLDHHNSELLRNINETLTSAGKKPINEIPQHYVHYWNGPYRFYVYLKTQNGEKLGWYISEKTKAKADEARKWIEQNVGDIARTTDTTFVDTPTRNKSNMLDHLLEIASETDPEVAALTKDFFDRLSTSQSKHLGEHFRQKYRTGVQGFLGKKPWATEAENFSDMLEGIRRKFDAGYEWVAVQKAKQELAPLLDAQAKGEINVGKAIEVGQQYFDHAFGRNKGKDSLTALNDSLEKRSPLYGNVRNVSREMDRVTSQLAIPHMLALKGTQIAQQTLQPFQSVLPKMVEFGTNGVANVKDIPASFAAGYLDGVLELGKQLPVPGLYKLSSEVLKKSDLSKAIEKYINENDINRVSLLDTQNIFNTKGFSSTVGNKLFDATFGIGMRLFEAPVRSAAFSAYTRLLVNSGVPLERALKIAHESMDTVVNYNTEAQSMAFQQLGAVGKEARGLHTFTINWFTQLARYMHEAGKTGKVAPATTFLVNSLLLAGVAGFLGADLVEKSIDVLKVAARKTGFDNPELQAFSFKQWLKESVQSDWLHHGVPEALTGLGLSGSFATKALDPNSSFLEAMFPVLNYKAGLVSNSIELLYDMVVKGATDAEIGSEMMKVVPQAGREKVRAVYNLEPVKDKMGNIKAFDVINANGERVYRRSLEEQTIAKHGLGLRSAKEVNTMNTVYDKKEVEKAVNDSRKAQLDSFDKMVNDLVVRQGKSLDKQSFQKKFRTLVEDWAYDPKMLERHIQQLAVNSNMENDLLRLVPKNINYSNYKKAQRLLSMQ